LRVPADGTIVNSKRKARANVYAHKITLLTHDQDRVPVRLFCVHIPVHPYKEKKDADTVAAVQVERNPE
jgi:hypothetical protein